MTLTSFFYTNPVFSLDQAVQSLGDGKNRRAMVDRLKHHVLNRRLKHVTRGIYAVVAPPGLDSEKFRPDPYLIGVSLRSDAVFSHHSALELLGASHTVWSTITLYSARRRKSLNADGIKYSVSLHPTEMVDSNGASVGTRRVEHGGKILITTGPERTLVEGFRKPALVGGLEELVNSARGFPVLDLSLLENILERFGTARLWAAAGWFLERFRAEFHVPGEFLDNFERRKPRGTQYTERKSRGGSFVKRWNLILPASLANKSTPDESQS